MRQRHCDSSVIGSIPEEVKGSLGLVEDIFLQNLCIFMFWVFLESVSVFICWHFSGFCIISASFLSKHFSSHTKGCKTKEGNEYAFVSFGKFNSGNIKPAMETHHAGQQKKLLGCYVAYVNHSKRSICYRVFFAKRTRKVFLLVHVELVGALLL